MASSATSLPSAYKDFNEYYAYIMTSTLTATFILLSGANDTLSPVKSLYWQEFKR